MLKRLNLVALVVLAAISLASAKNAVAVPLLAVDFNYTPNVATQAGFNSFAHGLFDFSPGPASFNQTYGAYTVTLANPNNTGANTAGFLNRNSLSNSLALTYADIYNDFAFINSSTNELDLSIAGVTPNTTYSLTLYSYDKDASIGAGTISTTFAPRNDGVTTFTTGGTGIVNWQAAAPTSNSQYSTTILVSSTTSTLDISATATGSTLRVNAFELNAVPEPTAAILVMIGIAGAARFRRRQWYSK